MVTKEFKYSLAKKGKILCVNCGKKTAVPYIENETGNVVEGAMRCDREKSCGYHKKPESNDVIVVEKQEYKPKDTSYIPLETLEKLYMNSTHDKLSEFLIEKFGIDKFRSSRNMYFLSDLGNGNTIFWQIDQLERVRSGKIMEYNSKTGKRVKDANGKAHINWMHTFLKIPEFNLKQCLFGLHLTKETRNKTIAIVESEKTAFIMSMCEPDFLWLATGSKNGFKLDYLAPIKLRKIIGFPDKGCFDDWNKVAIKLNELGFNIKINDFLEKSEAEQGEDIADKYLTL